MAENTPKYSVMMSTTGDAAEAELIAGMLVEKRLAACVQILPINSVYMWKGKIENATELLLLIKTRSNLVEAAKAVIREIHSYETPEIIALEIQYGLPEYLGWIDEVTA